MMDSAIELNFSLKLLSICLIPLFLTTQIDTHKQKFTGMKKKTSSEN